MSGQRRNRGPAHQNTFAFKHNPKSKKTERILASPIEGLCQRCHEKVEWRKKYRKYRPLSTPATCTSCHTKSVRAAYHQLCDPCAAQRKVCAGCREPKFIVVKTGAAAEKDLEGKRAELEREVRGLGLHLRKVRKILREFDRLNGVMDTKAVVDAAVREEGDEDEEEEDEEEEEEEEVEEEEEEEEEEPGEEE